MSEPLVRASSEELLSRRILDVPVAIFALETTGFPAGRHRICELSIVRVPAGGEPELAFDSLIAPGRPVTATEIHGLTDEDVVDAPRFEDVAADVVDALSGALLASYNVTFGVEFLLDALRRVGVDQVPPHFCLMFLRPMLGLGPRCSLEEACRQHGIRFRGLLSSRSDAEAAADLYVHFKNRLAEGGVETLGDLAARGELPFLASLREPMLPAAASLGLDMRAQPRRRIVRSLAGGRPTPQEAIRRYWQAVTAAVADFELSEAEAGLVRKMRELLRLSEEQMRAVHSRALVSAVVTFAGDDWLADDEAEKLRRLLACLSRLGWSPGE